MKKIHCYKKYKFTLIELLVVVAVFMTLISILQPSLRKMIENSKLLHCANNLRSAGVANGLYADDFDDYYVPQWQSSTDRLESFKTRWGHLAEFREYAGWDINVPSFWFMPNDKACPNAVIKTQDKLAEGGHSYSLTPPAIKVFYTYAHLFIGGNKEYRGMHRTWLQSPSQVGHVGEAWQQTRVWSGNFDDRHDNRTNILFYDGHIELYDAFVLRSSSQIKPWVDSNGLNLSNINQNNSPF